MPAQARRFNACLVALGRALIPATYTSAGNYAHDPALEIEFLPRLRQARRLEGLPHETAAAKLLSVDLIRGRNKVTGPRAGLPAV